LFAKEGTTDKAGKREGSTVWRLNLEVTYLALFSLVEGRKAF